MRGRPFRDFSALAVLLLAAAALRLYGLDQQSYWIDEHASLVLAEEGLLSGFARIRSDVHPPFYFALLHFWVQAFGASETSVRILSVIPNVAMVAFIGRLGSILFGRRAAWIAAFLTATSLLQIYYAQEARSYTWMMLFAVLSYDALVRWQLRGHVAQLLLYGLFTTALLYTHYFGLFVVAAQALYVLFLCIGGESPRRWLGWACSVVGIALFAAFWVPVFIDQFESVRQGFWIPRPQATALVRVPTLFLSWWGGWSGGSRQALFAAGLGATVVAFFALALLGAALSRAFDATDVRDPGQVPGWKATLLVFFWLALPVSLALQLSAIDIDVFTYRNTILCAPALLLLLAGGCAQLRHPLARALLVAAIAAPSFAQMPSYYTTPHKDQWREAAAYTAAAYRPETDAFIFDAPFVNRVFGFYGPHSTTRQIPLLTREPPGDERIWLVRAYAGPVTKSHEIVSGWGYHEIARWEGTRIEVLLFERTMAGARAIRP